MVLFPLDYPGGIKIEPINMLHFQFSLEGIKIEPINTLHMLIFQLGLEVIKIEAINTVCYFFN
jgi:hypothetical protein